MGTLSIGHGSNLTFDGTVECDATIMDGRTGDYGSVGSVSGITFYFMSRCLMPAHVHKPSIGVKNPIAAARAVQNHSREPDLLGRIRPT